MIFSGLGGGEGDGAEEAGGTEGRAWIGAADSPGFAFVFGKGGIIGKPIEPCASDLDGEIINALADVPAYIGAERRSP